MKETICFVIYKIKNEGPDFLCDYCNKPLAYFKEEETQEILYCQFYINYKGKVYFEKIMCEECGKEVIESYKNSKFYQTKVFNYEENTPRFFKRIIDETIKNCKK